jgi:hypothetical protein
MTPGLEQRLRTVRIIHFAMMASVLTLVAVGEVAGPKEREDVGFMLGVFAAVGAMNVVLAFILRKSLAGGAEERLRSNAEDAAAAASWQAGNILSFALAESVVLFGLVLRMIGGSTEQAAGFYAAGLGLLLILWPRAPQ